MSPSTPNNCGDYGLLRAKPFTFLHIHGFTLTLKILPSPEGCSLEGWPRHAWEPAPTTSAGPTSSRWIGGAAGLVVGCDLEAGCDRIFGRAMGGQRGNWSLGWSVIIKNGTNGPPPMPKHSAN